MCDIYLCETTETVVPQENRTPHKYKVATESWFLYNFIDYLLFK